MILLQIKNVKAFINLKRTSIHIHQQFKFVDIVQETNSNQGWTGYWSTILFDLRINKKKKIYFISKVPIFLVLRDRYLTLRGWFWTISTASWLLRCSQSPSDANITNWSWGCNWCTEIAGSALSIGFLKGSRRRNLAYKGSLLNSAFFKYTSPIDLEICKMKDSGNYGKHSKMGDASSQTSQHISTTNKILYRVIVILFGI